MRNLAPADLADDDPLARLVARATEILARPGAWMEGLGPEGPYLVRPTPDRRRRPALRLDEAAFIALAEGPGLKPRPDGGWTLASRPAPPAPAPPPGRPGVVVGLRPVITPEGRTVRRAANLGESTLLWLARHKDADGRPFITPLELLAGETLRRDVEASGLIGRMTMDWSGQPRGGGGLRSEPIERARAAKARVHAALQAVGPAYAAMLDRVCLVGSGLGDAERDLGLKARTGRAVLKAGLERLVKHYRLG